MYLFWTELFERNLIICIKGIWHPKNHQFWFFFRYGYFDAKYYSKWFQFFKRRVLLFIYPSISCGYREVFCRVEINFIHFSYFQIRRDFFWISALTFIFSGIYQLFYIFNFFFLIFHFDTVLISSNIDTFLPCSFFFCIPNLQGLVL